ncbi:g4768 [Coccomyxa viridis]|uniref:G4768 protein n=1 Tax=Coccomyxa viridis TaxID=1274662 RepID=A0ABP1FU33_9CHLO
MVFTLLLAVQVAAAALALFASRFVKRYFDSYRIYQKIKHYPGPRSESLLLGNRELPSRPDRHNVFIEWNNKYGSVLRRRFADTHILQVTDPAIIAEALRNKDLDKQPLSKALNYFAGPHSLPTLLTSGSNERWKASRKAAATAFSTANMRAQFPNIRLACSQLIEVLKGMGPNEVVDMDNALCRESLDVIGRVGFGVDMGATHSLRDTDKSGEAMEATAGALLEADRRMNDPIRKYLFWRQDVRAGTAVTKRFHSIMQRLVDGMRKQRPEESSIAAHLLDIQDPETGKPITDERLLPEVSTLFMAGFETTGHTAAWVVYTVSQHPQVEAKIVEELKSLDLLATPEQPQPRPIQWDDVPKLTYLTAVIKETMRIYPAAGGASMRRSKTGKDVVLGGGKLVVPAGVALHMPITAVHHNEAIWENAKAFIPERFLEEGAEDAKGVPKVGGRQPQRFVPFTQGARDCVGQTLARLNLSTTLAQLFGSFSFRLAEEMGGPEGVRAAEMTSITLSCTKGMKMHAIARVPS